MMKIFWTAVVFSLFGWTVEVYGIIKESYTISVGTVSSTTLPTVAPTEDEGIKLVDWLTKYGYLPPPDPSTGQLQAWTAVTQALKNMQRFAGLEETGVLDAETLRLMQTPRCSLPDDDELISQAPGETLNQRMKRAASTWKRRNINWRLRSYPASSRLSREMIRSLVFYALRVWADPTTLEFHEVRGTEGTDLQVDFWHGSHGDGYPFDGAGGSVGHAFFPSDPERAGGVHLDAEEHWSFRQPAGDGTDLFTVLVHELGHALGLSHSSAKHSVMRPYYQGPMGDPLHFSLGPLDLKLITALYGKRGNHIPTESPILVSETQYRHRHGGFHRHTHMQRHTLDSSLNRCNTSFDAVTKIRGEIFFFKGQSMWRVSRAGLVSIRAVPVQRLWSALPHSLPPFRAVLERSTDHAILFIAGSQVWLFRDLSLQEDYPQPISSLDDFKTGEEGLEWRGLHWDPVQGAVWGSVNEDNAQGESEVWKELIKGGVNGIITENSNQRESTGEIKGTTYLFKGNSYWRFSQPGSEPEEGFPRLLAPDWLDCPQSSSFSPEDISLITHYDQQDLTEEKNRRSVDQFSPKDNKADKDHTPHFWDCPCKSSAGIRSGNILMITFLFTVNRF